MLQADLRSVLRLVGAAAIVSMTYFWVKIERPAWVLYCWIILMFLGLLLTDLCFFLGGKKVFANLCLLWLAMSGIWYLVNGFAVRSRAFSGKFLSFVGHYNGALHRRLVFPINGRRNAI